MCFIGHCLPSNLHMTCRNYRLYISWVTILNPWTSITPIMAIRWNKNTIYLKTSFNEIFCLIWGVQLDKIHQIFIHMWLNFFFLFEVIDTILHELLDNMNIVTKWDLYFIVFIQIQCNWPYHVTDIKTWTNWVNSSRL